jgi:hypothetical protein
MMKVFAAILIAVSAVLLGGVGTAHADDDNCCIPGIGCDC